MSEQQFYYVQNGASQGPVSVSELVNLLKSGVISRETKVWRQGYDGWKALSETEIDISFLPPPIEDFTPPPAVPQAFAQTANQGYSAQPQYAAQPQYHAPTHKSSNVFMDYFVNVITKNYAKFSGRARRQEYWFFALFNGIIGLVLYLLDTFLTGFVVYVDYSTPVVIPVLYLIYSLALFLPSLALSVRRLHDTDKSGWFLLLHLIPFIGGIILLVFFCLDSHPMQNRYGPSPKYAQ